MDLRNDRANDPRYEVVVIGAGQAGLALGYHLARQGRRFLILDRADALASAWRERWDSLTLFTSRRYDSLPGLPFPGDPDGYPGRDEVVAYLERYAQTFELPVALGATARSIAEAERGFAIALEDGWLEADQVVVATGPFQTPRTPAFADGLSPEVAQLHAAGYRNPDSIPEGKVLLVGGGNTGFQIAAELSRSREVHLAVGSRQTPLPQRILGRDLFWYLEATGLIHKSVDTKIGGRLAGRDTLIGSSPRALKRGHGVKMHPRVVAADGSRVSFADGGTLDVNAVIWATGYGADYSWIDLPVLDGDGRPVHRRGVTEIPGLYFLGLSWQHTRGSALLGFVGDDAEYIARQIAAFRPSTPTAVHRRAA